MTGEAQNQLGQLFIDLGVGGVGKTLKALNSVSATFLLTKNTATQLIKPLVDIGKQSLNSAVEIGKLSASFGTSLVEAQKFAYYLKEKNLSEGLLGDLSSMQTKFAQIKSGFAGVDGQMAMSMNMLGLDWQNYDGSSASMLQYVKDVQNAVKGMETQTARMHLQNLGLGNSDWLYAFQRGDFNLADINAISDKEALELIRLQERLSALSNNADSLKKKITLLTADNEIVDKAIGKTEEVLDQAAKGNISEKNKKAAKNVAGFGGGIAGAKIGGTVGRVGGVWGTIGGAVVGGAVGSILGEKKMEEFVDNINKKGKKGKPTGQAAQLDLSYNPLSNLNQTPTQTVNISNDITISGENAQETADRIAAITSEQITQLQYNQYQSYNMAGV